MRSATANACRSAPPMPSEVRTSTMRMSPAFLERFPWNDDNPLVQDFSLAANACPIHLSMAMKPGPRMRISSAANQ